LSSPTRSQSHWHRWYVTFTKDDETSVVIVLLPRMSEAAAGTLALRWGKQLGLEDKPGDSVTLRSALKFAKPKPTTR